MSPPRQRRKNGELVENAKAFGGSKEIQSGHIPSWPTNDIDDAAYQLERGGMLITLFADDTLAESILADGGIAYMEHRFGNEIDKIATRVATLRTILFG